MTYALYRPVSVSPWHTDRWRGLGVDVAQQAKQAAEDQWNQYKAQVEAEAEAQGKNAIKNLEESSPEAKAFGDELNKYKRYLPKWTPSDAESGVRWCKEALTKYANDQTAQWKQAGVSFAKGELETSIKNVASSYGLGGFHVDKIPENEKELYYALVDIGTTYAAAELGIDPKIAKVTIDSIKDGELSRDDCIAIGQTSGAIAGAAICQTFGIPAPIGAFFGGKFGGMIGETFADVFDIGEDAEDRWKKYVAQQRALLAGISRQAESACEKVRTAYWETFDKYIIDLESRWERAELKIGWRFDLRWFDNQWSKTAFTHRWDPIKQDYVLLNQPKIQYDPAIKGYKEIGPWTTYARGTDFCKSLVTVVGSGEQVRSKVCMSICPFPYGCPYPPMQYTFRYGGLEKPKLLTREAPASPTIYANANRVIRAYAARGLNWQTAKERQAGIRCPFTGYGPGATDLEYRNFWLAAIDRTFAYETEKLRKMNQVSVRIVGDLSMTAAMVGIQKSIFDASRGGALKGIDATRALGALTVHEDIQSTAMARSRNALVNNGTLLGGLGLLGYAAWRSRR